MSLPSAASVLGTAVAVLVAHRKLAGERLLGGAVGPDCNGDGGVHRARQLRQLLPELAPGCLEGRLAWLDLAGSPAPQVDNWITQQFAQPRQAVVDHKGAVFGYELFDRSLAVAAHSAASDAQLLFTAPGQRRADYVPGL